ncbi:hypothetical protein [Clostridium sp. MD294]|uniref:hypothetical protein n=1 Tax=Clostridium sp. MD294 TaxID=97138 RepID=UPI0015D5AD82|nr:hypothetical protein [Clostridium sp. MD294]
MQNWNNVKLQKSSMTNGDTITLNLILLNRWIKIPSQAINNIFVTELDNKIDK